jgi:hypothetical protein
MTSTRDEVYVAVRVLAESVEATYKEECAQRKLQHVPLFNWETSEFIRTLLALDQTLITLPSVDPRTQINVIQCMATWGVLCMKNRGCCARDVNSGDAGVFYEAPLSDARIEAIIDTERQYQTEMWPSATPTSVSGQILLIRRYMDKVVEAWADNPGNEYALDMLRKVVGLTVCCLEDHGIDDGEY